MLAGCRRECFIRSLNNALGANVNPASRGHLAVHRELERFEAVEFVARCPMRYQVRIRNQDARRMGKGSKHSDGFSGLNQQRLIVFQTAQCAEDRVKRVPASHGASRTSVNDQFPGILGDLFVEIVH